MIVEIFVRILVAVMLFNGLLVLFFVPGGVVDFFFNKLVFKTEVNRAEYLEISRILSKRMTYFKNLSPKGKAKFVNRVVDFAKHKKFLGRENLIVTNEIRYTISGAAVQITFGLSNYLIEKFHTIHVFPKTFYSPRIKAEMKGGTYPMGVIAFSWADFEKGYAIDDDKLNLGLHEMGHAFMFSVKSKNDFGLQLNEKLDSWMKVGTQEYHDLRKGKGSWLRKYGGTNRAEFFAVCIEHFFEAPKDFLENIPEVYSEMVELLNQDPANAGKDYAKKSNYTKRSKKTWLSAGTVKKKEPQKATGWSWAYGVLIAGFLVGWIGFAWAANVQLVKANLLGPAYFAGVLGSGIVFFHLVRKGVFSFLEFVPFILLSVAPLSIAAVTFIDSISIVENVTRTRQLEGTYWPRSVDYFYVEKQDGTGEWLSGNSAFQLEEKNEIEAYKVEVIANRGLIGLYWPKATYLFFRPVE